MHRPLLSLFALLGTLTAADVAPLLDPADDAAGVVAKAASVVPSARQVAWQRREFTAFLHFGMNTFTDREWGEGTEDPRAFNPTDLDARQWVAACQAAGISAMILTVKHHDGFHLWPTRFSSHSVAASPWKDGKGDAMAEFAAACRAAGMPFGFYLSPWDRHEPTYGSGAGYNEHFVNQLKELLTAYPDVVEVWFDGACGEGANGKRQVYDWRAYWQTIRTLAPQAAITVRGPDVRWCGNEAGKSRAAEWSVLPLHGGDGRPWEVSDATLRAYDRDVHGDDLGSRDVLLGARGDRAPLVWYPSQVDTSIRPGWFYHASEDGRVRSLTELDRIWYGAVGGNTQLLLNIPPDRRGRLHEADAARLAELGNLHRRTFTTNLAATAKVTAQVEGGRAVGDVQALVAGDADRCWTTTDRPTAVAVTLDLPAPVTFNVVSLQEHLPSGQRLEGVAVEVRDGDAWREIGRTTTIGHRRLLRVPDTTARAVRLRLLDWRVRPTLATLGLFQAPALLAPPTLRRDRDGTLTITAPPGAVARYTVDGTEPTAASPVATGPIALPLGGTVTARSEASTAGNGVTLGEAPTARRTYGLATAGWTITTDSEEAKDGAARLAVDDDPGTMWHSAYRNGQAPLPHHLALDLGRTVTVAALTYLPRQDRWTGGIARRVAVDVRGEGEDAWRTVVAGLDLDNVVNSRALQTIPLPTPVACRAVRLTVLANDEGNGLASAAEVGVIPVR